MARGFVEGLDRLLGLLLGALELTLNQLQGQRMMTLLLASQKGSCLESS